MNMFKNKTATAKFYKELAMVEEVYTGYLHKSPAQLALLKTFKSWKHRFFVLSKTSEDVYHLTYYTNNEKRDKPLGMIDLSKIILMFTGLETHPMRDWIQKHFKCPPSSVLFLRVEDNTHENSRDYFLIGENSDDVDGWYKALNSQKSNQRRHTFDTLEDNRNRSTSAPLNGSEQKAEDQSDERWSAPEFMLSPPSTHYDYPRKFSEPPVPAECKDSRNRSTSAPLNGSEQKAEDQSDERWSAPEFMLSPPSTHYDYPRKFREPPVPAERKISVNEDKDEKSGKQDEFPEDSNAYMIMASVQKVLEDVQQEADNAFIQTNTSINGHESSVCNGAVKQDTDDENKRMSTGERHSLPCLLNFNRNCASTEKVEAPLNKSETRTHMAGRRSALVKTV
ncbi:uncharacterized protein LOC143709874 [Siphateles boraxobius]|uniref:uncharacterized protein LOC143709874 n=1 Tax=Siphateles boraxobius TaxID=180520 RepID=UPI0040638C30